MNRSDLIHRISTRHEHLSLNDAEASVKVLLDSMSNALSEGQRIEVRGFGSFCLHYRSVGIGRNPHTGESVHIEARHVPHFKAGKELRERVNGKGD